LANTAAAASLDPERVEKFVVKVVEDIGAAMRGGLCYIGDRLRIFKAMAVTGAVTVEELARHTGLNPRYLQEWLGAMTTGGYVEYNPETGRYLLPPEHAAALADESFPYFAGGFLQMIVPALSVAPQVAEAFRTGKGVDQNRYPAEMFESIERGTAPWYRNQLVQNWLPTMPQVVEALEAGGTALDVGCGSGRAAITLSKAFPKARIAGYDSHALSIDRAIHNADAEGVNVEFAVRDCVELPVGRFDFITTFDVIHDAVDPVGLMKGIRGALKQNGTFLMLEMRCSPKLEENANPVGRFLYSISTLYCMTTSLAHDGAGIGAAMGEPKARDLAGKAGFSSFRKLPIDDPFSMLYELRP
jgi:2-polyprenyl-3-methyl-5-hydroxy-6-metoxy-1,4-benzoquinol methylase